MKRQIQTAVLLATLVDVTFGVCTSSNNEVRPLVGFKLFPRQIMEVDGIGEASVIWDSNELQAPRPSETTGFPYFQVPRDAAPGEHTVCFRPSDGRCVDFTVTVDSLSGPWPAPRIEQIGIGGPPYENDDGTARVRLAIPVANADLNAKILVNGKLCENVYYLAALLNPYFANHHACTYGYPVYHYVSFIAVVDSCQLGKNLIVRVVNSDTLFAERAYYIPSTLDSLDSDGDGLLDSWEFYEYDTPDGKIDLQELGCDPYRKDILVEVDWTEAAEPDDDIWEAARKVFEDAPVLNPDGTQGISIHIDHGPSKNNHGGNELEPHATIDFCGKDTLGHRNFYSYKSDRANFDPARREIFHYCIFGNAMPGGDSSASGYAEIVGNDFLVALVNKDAMDNPLAVAGTFVHELGHNLGLHHGGIENDSADMDCTFKPNQPSTMNYRYQITGVSLDCDLIPEPVHTFSQGMLAPIPLAGVFFDERFGICDSESCDIDNDNSIDPKTVVLRNCIDTTKQIMWYYDYDEWGNVILNFRQAGSGWKGN